MRTEHRNRFLGALLSGLLLAFSTAAAEAAPGVHLVITGAQAAELTGPLPDFGPDPTKHTWRCLAAEKVRYVGEGVAVVVGVEVEEFDAHGGSAGGADLLGVDADDFAELTDDHHFGGVVDEGDAGDFADFGGGLHVDDAFAAAFGQAIVGDNRLFAEALLGNREDFFRAFF